MANIKSAQKRQRQDAKKSEANATYKKTVKQYIKKAARMKKGTKKADSFIDEAYSNIDKAKKHKTIHKNKAARLKSRVSRLVS